MTTAAIGEVVRELWELGARHGRVPEPTPEVDPWEDDDPYPDRAVAAVVVFTGRPSIVVRLADDGLDTVTVEDVLVFDVPRRDTVAVVGSVMSGRARLDGPGGILTRWSSVLFGSAAGCSVRVPLDDGRAYSCQLPSLAWSSWIGSLPVGTRPAR
ncbi:hypothetical protein Cch01nite_07400 [Cellulomonas chitinilytica]|uniref:Uncharacterized protein n=1 Tax=Cellulomonas chitinilytica TaxID=398759 RepID=A0A919U026_9CELL|nr:hypothetical protein [Cellulomonas chitinilytica]GIG20016.1 hypothetical protein Cch01nite_07400 [Cellulomonas chitinilytica]